MSHNKSAFTHLVLKLLPFISILNLTLLQREEWKKPVFKYKAFPYYWLSRMRCNGLESTLLECDHAGWGPHKCSKKTPVYLECEKSPMFRGDQVDLATIQVRTHGNYVC